MDTQNTWAESFGSQGALWMHDGNVKRPHALLTSGMHSSGFFNGEVIMRDPVQLDLIARSLVDKLEFANRFDTDPVEYVAGPALGAITLAHDLARVIRLKHDNGCDRTFAEKDGDAMVFNRTPPRSGSLVLTCEDTVTTAKSLRAMHQAITACGAHIAPHALMILNRSGLTEVDGVKLVSLVSRELPIWEPDDCPLCKQGSEALKPKVAGNWNRLTATY